MDHNHHKVTVLSHMISLSSSRVALRVNSVGIGMSRGCLPSCMCMHVHVNVYAFATFNIILFTMNTHY